MAANAACQMFIAMLNGRRKPALTHILPGNRVRFGGVRPELSVISWRRHSTNI